MPPWLGIPAVCKLDKENFFCCGGKRGGILGDTMIVNTQKKIFETLQSNSANSTAGSALKDNKVYVFGGTSDWKNAMDSCKVFDLETKVWSPIATMPVASYCTTAALHNNTIILSGNHLAYLYSFDGSSFLSVLNLPANAFKVVFDRWNPGNKKLLLKNSLVLSIIFAFPHLILVAKLWIY